EIRPFDCETYQGYRCTGCRSQDKSFHVEGALTHIFTRSLPHIMPEKLKMEKTIGKQTVCFELPAELSNYINSFGISDWRLLWSADPRFLKHFEFNPLGPFSPFSLYPPSYLHDISFWMEPESYDELDFHALVREASCGAVKDMALVDRFRHPHMGHASLCYRLTYQSPDQALSHIQALGLQNQLRRLLPLRLQVTLR
ncbi:ferredoxin-fold anticodon-binding domain-containing protein 1-like, partial [Sinocyclocheilus grahami]|uniref:ferredoxin-fold anticodon-binding domain-containing protein 1-like n=1 Tax=Sinocyclocheilus grahami TaxID=75366 RepID=UPI0007AC70AB